MRRAVFLDRDGVINRALVCCGEPYPPTNLAELEIFPGVGAAELFLPEGVFRRSHLMEIYTQLFSTQCRTSTLTPPSDFFRESLK